MHTAPAPVVYSSRQRWIRRGISVHGAGDRSKPLQHQPPSSSRQRQLVVQLKVTAPAPTAAADDVSNCEGDSADDPLLLQLLLRDARSRGLRLPSAIRLVTLLNTRSRKETKEWERASTRTAPQHHNHDMQNLVLACYCQRVSISKVRKVSLRAQVSGTHA